MAVPAKIKKTDAKPIVLCHLADVHLGYRRYNRISKQGVNQRELDVNQAFHEAVSRIIALKPDLTIVAGDLFHHVRPSNSIITFCFREIRRLAAGTQAPVIILAGNHEAPKRADTGCALRILAEIEGVFVSDSNINKFDFADIHTSVTCLPHPSLIEGAQKTLRADDNFTHNILVAHGQIGRQHISDFGGAEIDFKALGPHEWNYIALGHVHVRRDVSYNASYSGALEHTAANIWSEAGHNKGFLQVELPSLKRTFHALSAPREVIDAGSFDAIDLEPSQVIEQLDSKLSALPGGVEGKIVRLEILNLSREVYRNLNHKKLREWRAKCLNLTIEIKSPHSSVNGPQRTMARAVKLRDELIAYCEATIEKTEVQTQVKGLLVNYLEQLEAADEAH